MKEFVLLSFSYMSFVIKDKIELQDKCMVHNVFDIEPYNYIFNKRTCFLDDDFVMIDFNQLGRVLSNFEKIDKDLVDLLNYTNKIKNKKHNFISALSRAIAGNNYKCIDLILIYLAKTS